MRTAWLKSGFLALFLLPFASQAAPVAYQFDPMHTTVLWRASHFGFSNPSGKFMKVEGTLLFDEENPENSSVNVTIYIPSLVTGIEKFDAHLKSKDFFDAEAFPTASFSSQKVEMTGEDTARIHGMLTIKGVAKPQVLEVQLNRLGETPMTKQKTAGFSASGTVYRSDFGIDFALPGVADAVTLDIQAEAPLAATSATPAP